MIIDLRQTVYSMIAPRFTVLHYLILKMVVLLSTTMKATRNLSFVLSPNLKTAIKIAGHNIISYDLRVLKIYGFFEPKGEIVDTLILSRLYHPDMLALDQKMKWKDMPTKLYGRHSLESYGYRLNARKGDYGKENDFKEWSQEMQDYCVQDVVVTTKLCNHFQPYLTGLR